MNNDVVILIAEDDDGHAALIRRNLERAGLTNSFLHFRDGEETLNFLQCNNSGLHREPGVAYLLLLDIRMPKKDGIQVLEAIKRDPVIKKMPVIMITTTDDPREISHCHQLGCNCYLTKPIDYDKFVNAVTQLGEFLKVNEIPQIEEHGND